MFGKLTRSYKVWTDVSPQMGNSCCCGHDSKSENLSAERQVEPTPSPYTILSYKSYENLTPVELFSFVGSSTVKPSPRERLKFANDSLRMDGSLTTRKPCWINPGFGSDYMGSPASVRVRVTEIGTKIESPGFSKIPNVLVSTFLLDFFQRHGTKTAVIDARTSKMTTYRDLRQRIIKTQNGLMKLEFNRSDVVCKFAPISAVDWVLLIAVTSLGALYFSVDPHTTTKECLQDVLMNCRATRIFTSFAHLDDVMDVVEASSYLHDANTITKPKVYITDECAEGYPSLTSITEMGQCIPLPEPEVDPKSTAAICLFKENSMVPVIISHYSLISGLIAFIQPMPFCSQDVFLPFTSFVNGAESFVLQLACLVAGGSLLTLPMVDPVQQLEAMETYAVTAILANESVLHFIKEHPVVDDYKLDHITQIYCSAKCPNFERERRVSKKFNIPMVNYVYGSAETLVTHLTRNGYNRRGSVGKPLSGVDCRIIDVKSGSQKSVCSSGRVCIRSPQVCMGYLNDPVGTSKLIDSQGWVYTEEYGYIDEDGYLFIEDLVENVLTRLDEADLPEADQQNNSLKYRPKMVKHTPL